MTRRFQCGCIVNEDDTIKFCKDHWMDYLVTGNVIYPKNDDGSIFLIKDKEFINPFGNNIFNDIKRNPS